MNDNGDFEFKIRVSEPYVGTDWQGNEVILQDEELLREDKSISFMERIIDANPSPAEIFRVKLKNPWDSNKVDPKRMPLD